MVYYQYCTNRGGSGALYPQSAIAEANSPIEVWFFVQLEYVSGVDSRVLRNSDLWTSSGGEPSSDKQSSLCAAGVPGSS